MRTGIEFERGHLGLVPEIEEREAALLSGYPWVDWRTLHYDERCGAIAFYRMHHLIRLHSEEAQTMQARMDTLKANHSG